MAEKIHACVPKVIGTYKGSRVLDGSVHLKSHALVIQSASVACCALSVCVPLSGQYSDIFCITSVPRIVKLNSGVHSLKQDVREWLQCDLAF
jgi:hypothetical protein